MVINLKIENFTLSNSTTTLSFIIFCHHLQLLPRKVNLLHLPQLAPFNRRRFPLLPLPRQSFFQTRTTAVSTIDVTPSFPVGDQLCHTLPFPLHPVTFEEADGGFQQHAIVDDRGRSALVVFGIRGVRRSGVRIRSRRRRRRFEEITPAFQFSSQSVGGETMDVFHGDVGVSMRVPVSWLVVPGFEEGGVGGTMSGFAAGYTPVMESHAGVFGRTVRSLLFGVFFVEGWEMWYLRTECGWRFVVLCVFKTFPSARSALIHL